MAEKEKRKFFTTFFAWWNGIGPTLVGIAAFGAGASGLYQLLLEPNRVKEALPTLLAVGRALAITREGIIKRARPVNQMTIAQFESTLPDEEACIRHLVAFEGL